MLDRRIMIAAALLSLAAGPAFADGVPAAAVHGDMSLGNPKAKVHVVEYASASCPHCARFDTQVFPAFKAKYVDTGRVYYTLKEFLTAPPAVAAAGFIIARCGGTSKYFKILDDVFKSQDQWQGDLKPIFTKIAADNGVTAAQVEACLNDDAAIQALDDRFKRAMNVDGITSTPTFVINGKRMEGEVTLAQLDDAIAQAGAKAPVAPTGEAKGR